MKNDNVYISIDVGGTHVRIAKFYSLSEPKFENVKVFELAHVFENDFRKIVEAVSGMTENSITAIGIGIPGVLNNEKNALISATNIPEWIGVDIKKKLEDIFNCNVSIENDAVASALGEFLYGGKYIENFIFIIWGTGVGGAFLELKPSLKATKLQKEDYLEEIRQRSYGKNLLEKYGKPLGDLESKDWEEIIVDFKKLLIHVCSRFGAKNIIIGGGIALKQKERIGRLSQNLKEDGINLSITKLGDSHTFGLYGAAALIHQKKNNV